MNLEPRKTQQDHWPTLSHIFKLARPALLLTRFCLVLQQFWTLVKSRYGQNTVGMQAYHCLYVTIREQEETCSTLSEGNEYCGCFTLLMTRKLNKHIPPTECTAISFGRKQASRTRPLRRPTRSQKTRKGILIMARDEWTNASHRVSKANNHNIKWRRGNCLGRTISH